MLLEQERNGIREGVDEAPKFYLLQSRLRERSTLVIIFTEALQQAPTLKGEESLSGKNQPQMAAFPEPLLQVPTACGTSGKQLRPTRLKLPTILVRNKVGRRARIDSKSKMDHPLSRNNRALSRRYVVAEVNRRVQESVDGASGLGTRRFL